mmetsp:Transcript_42690/g.71239  ORF Transcript_42690/g.71239 Transcript_42690/m.71239 type:complete len:370 (+) Transcript_42690:70-1179(+)
MLICGTGPAASSRGMPKKTTEAMTVVWPMVTWNRALDFTAPLKKRILSTAAMAPSIVGTDRGSASRPRSISLASSCVTQMPRRSPFWARGTDLWNICMLFTFFSTFKCATSTVWLTSTEPCRTVPVRTVPWPLMEKQWSTANRKGPSRHLGTRGTRSSSFVTNVSMPMALEISSVGSMLTAPPGRADTATMSHPENLVPCRVSARRFFIFSIFSARVASGSMSTLLSTTTMCWVRISPTTRHSAVCVWMPLVTSTTSIIRSMICAPPMMVRMSDACPGQSTSVNWRKSLFSDAFKSSGVGTVKPENPKSSVIPRSALCGCLSSEAVDSIVLSARARLVFPLSTCPRMPTFTLKVDGGAMVTRERAEEQL